MIKNVDFINVRVILDRLLRHPLLNDLNLELAVQYATEFIDIMGLTKTYVDKYVTVDISDFRGILPCDVVSINQVRLSNSKVMLGNMTNNFKSEHGDIPTFKTQGRIIHTSVKDTTIDISYKGMLVDEEGYPLLPDNSVFLKALELYIKKEWFTILFDMGKITSVVMNNTQQEYAFKVKQCNNEFTLPSVVEMQAIANSLNQLLPRVNEFETGFKDLGSKEHIKLR